MNKVVFDNQAASSSTSGFTDKDLYSIKKNKNTKAVYDALLLRRRFCGYPRFGHRVLDQEFERSECLDETGGRLSVSIFANCPYLLPLDKGE